MQRLGLAAFVVAVCGASVSAALKCLNYNALIPHSRKCVWFSRASLAHNDAASLCTSLGGQLISIESTFEQSFIYGTAKAAGLTGGFWIRLNDGQRSLKCPNRNTDNRDSYYNRYNMYTTTTPSPAPHREYVNFASSTQSCENSSWYYFAIEDSGRWHQMSAPQDYPGLPAACQFERIGWNEGSCNGSYVRVPSEGKCFYFASSKANITSASKYCRRFGATLASVTKLAEVKLLNASSNASNDGYFIGLRDIADNGDWRWTDGRNSSFRNWDQGFPFNQIGMNCVQALPSTGKWINVECEKELHFVCQTVDKDWKEKVERRPNEGSIPNAEKTPVKDNDRLDDGQSNVDKAVETAEMKTPQTFTDVNYSAEDYDAQFHVSARYPVSPLTAIRGSLAQKKSGWDLWLDSKL